MFSLVPLLLLLVSSSWAFVPVGETLGDFKPSTWEAAPAAAQPAVAAARAAPANTRAEGRAFGNARLKHGYGSHKASHHKVDMGLDPGKIVLKCKVQEPLEHIVWIRQKCPNDHYDGGHLVAEGATVQDKSLYDVRLLGGNSSITSELQLKKPLDPQTAGFFRCEAWPHGGGGPPYGQNVAQDVYVIGGQEMLRRCFGGWDDGGHHTHDSWAKHRSNEPVAAPAPAPAMPPAPQQPSAPHLSAPLYHSSSSYHQPQTYHHHQQPYIPRYNYSDLRHSSSHETPEVAVPNSRPRKEQEASTAAPILTRTGAYHPQVATTTEAAPPATATQQPVVRNSFSPSNALPPRSYIAATPQPLVAPFIPSLPFSQHMMQRLQHAEAPASTAAPLSSNNSSSAANWDIEDMMKGYPAYRDSRKGKAVKEEAVVIVTPEPQVAA